MSPQKLWKESTKSWGSNPSHMARARARATAITANAKVALPQWPESVGRASSMRFRWMPLLVLLLVREPELLDDEALLPGGQALLLGQLYPL
jgi:hypothetical protein